MPVIVSFESIAEQVTSETLILTPNSRTQKALNAGFVASLNEGEVVYAHAIKSLSQWQEALWQELSFLSPMPVVIGQLELKTWLKEQISKDENWQLTNALGVAEKVLEAYRSLSQWGLSLNDVSEIETVENQYFVKWIELLEAFLADNALVPQFAVTAYLCQQPALRQLLPKQILLVSFNQLTPAEETLFDLCRQSGVEISSYYPAKTKVDAVRIEQADLNGELAFAGQLAVKIAREYPDKSIGVVVNQLANHLSLTHQIFSDIFQPEESLPWRPLEKVKYNVSAGQSLVDLPMISVAVKILQLNALGFDLATMQLLKNSPFINWGDNGASIRYFLHQLVLLGYNNYSPDFLLAQIDAAENADKLSLLKDRLAGIQNKPTRARPVNAWIDVWKSELRMWGWCENYSADTFEEKLISDFYTALNECHSLGQIYPRPTLSQASEFFLQLLRQTPFQLPSDRTNVQVLGILEATGLEFDDLILVGFNRENWPQKAKLNPFLPVKLQQHYNMPGSSAEREYEYTLGLSQSLLNAADRIWVTQSHLADESLSGESPLFSHLPMANPDDWIPQLNKVSVTPDYHWHLDEQIQLPQGEIKGGAYMLGNYASCPFKAMSQFQFNIKPGEKAQKGIEAKVKGAWLHRALELLWLRIQTQSKLLALSSSEEAALISEVLEASKKEFERQLYARAPVEIVMLEFEKLQGLISQWLSIEKQRQPFSVQTEVEKSLTLGPLSFKFRVDRIDTNVDGRLEIIDYKTGQTDMKKWLGERPEEAQMPAYVLACQDSEIDSLTYARIKTGEVSRSGVYFSTDAEIPIRFTETNLQGEKDKTRYMLAKEESLQSAGPLAEQWQHNLTHLAEKIAAGDMPVSPKHRVESCRYCDFSDFCRINEIQPDDSKTLSDAEISQ